ncbi:glutathione peroxidase [Marinobacterium zhoushanense]|uniref:Glutathione peroxidase n=1 Tax=Marinobacterium zhoushanense TaxID=1679163 RepID=A0ABQ1KC60_9GAMM|nr:glutathione peroxidase [Marinobacterium zhoushanense]GGB95377.1 glutathione peroxidase [Marinobacterium zhoushanense]
MLGSQSAVAGCPPALDFTVRTLAGKSEIKLCEQYAGQVLLIVNTASRCAFTKQYDGLETLYARYRERGFAVLGFPSNDFGGQEPGTEEQIQEFCRTTYGVEFPMFGKTHVRGEDIDPFWRHLVDVSGTRPKWNFYKYLIGRDGEVVETYSSMTSPDSNRLLKDIEAALAEPLEAERGSLQ